MEKDDPPVSIYYNIRELNKYSYPRVLRCYQKLIVDRVKFYMVIDYNLFLFVGSECWGGRNRLYFIRNNKYYIIKSSGAGKGYELEEKALLKESPIPSFSSNKIVVKTGHANFAHFIWNQLPALLEIVNANDILYFQEIDSIIDIKKLGFNVVDKFEKSKVTSLYLGSSLVTHKARQVLLNEFSKDKNENKDEVERSKMSIYLGVRGPGNRELLNEVEFYVSLIKELKSVYGKNIDFLIDGFSFQNNNIGDIQAIKRCLRIERVIDIIKENVDCSIESINGLKLRDFICKIRDIDFYITHEGTMQHKIGWLYPDIPGLVLTGSSSPRTVASWHQRQIEHDLNNNALSVLPKYLVRQHTENKTVRNNKFEIIDIPQAVDEVLRFINKDS